MYQRLAYLSSYTYVASPSRLFSPHYRLTVSLIMMTCPVGDLNKENRLLG